MENENIDEKSLERRDELLLRMYDQLWNSINSHILGIWQSIGVVIGAFAVFALVEKQTIPIDWAVSLILILCIWLISNVVDSSYWYNRNLVIIANIEKDFLPKKDGKDISYYYLEHRRKNKKITHFKIQLWFSIGIGGLFLLYHLINRLYPLLSTIKNDIQAFIPYMILIIGIFVLYSLEKKRNSDYNDIIVNSPGKNLVDQKPEIKE